MANNRMCIRCKQCGEVFVLATHCLDYYATTHTMRELDDFLYDHAYCDKPLNKKDIKWIDTPFKREDDFDHRFEICYEFDDRDKEERENEKKIKNK